MIREYIDSGILEAYVIGAASEQEEKEVLRMKAKYPEVKEALLQLELDMEKVARHTAIIPPTGTWDKIEREINEITPRPEVKPAKFSRTFKPNNDKDNGFIEVGSTSTHMRIHKNWRWVFAAVFVLGKIFLGCAIYFYLENRQAQLQIKELKTEISHYQK